MASVKVSDPHFKDFVSSVLDEETEVSADDISSEEEDNIEVQSESEFEIEAEDSDSEIEEESGNIVKGKDGHVCSTVPPKRSRTAVRNIVHIPRGKGPYANISSEQDAFNKLIDKNMIDIIVKQTNEEISRRRSNYSDQRFVGDTDAVEILALIGLLYISGNRKDSHLTTCDMFSSIYKCIMS